MGTEMKDMLGKPLAVGDEVVMLIRNVNQYRMQHARITSLSSHGCVLAYELPPTWYRTNVRNMKSFRFPSELVKVAV